jgi:hypothetical protein
MEGIAIALIVLWFVGVITGYTLGNFIYVPLGLGVLLLLARLVGAARAA